MKKGLYYWIEAHLDELSDAELRDYAERYSDTLSLRGANTKITYLCSIELDRRERSPTGATVMRNKLSYAHLSDDELDAGYVSIFKKRL